MRGSEPASRIRMRRREVNADDISRRFDLIEQPRQRLPSSAPCVQYPHAGTQAHARDQATKLGFGE